MRAADLLLASLAGIAGVVAGGCEARRSRPPAAPDAARPAAPDAASPRDPQGLLPDTEAQRDALQAGKDALEQGRAAAALTRFLRASQGPPSGLAVSAGLAAAELQEIGGDRAAAQATYERLSKIAPKVPEVALAAGRFFDRSGDAARALTALRRALRLQPDLLPVYPALGVILARVDRAAESAEVFLAYETRLNGLKRRLRDATVRLGDRLAVVELFATLKDERATLALIEALKVAEPEVRVAAAAALADDPAPRALQALAAAALAESHPIARRAMTESLRRGRDRMAATEPRPRMPAPQPVKPAPSGRD